MNQSQKMNRRSFFSSFAKFAGLAVVAPTIISSVFTTEAQAQKKRGEKPAAGGSGLPMVDEKDSVAKAVKYVADAKKAPEAKGNDCTNCSFYAKKGDHAGKEAGTCTIFAGKWVYGAAWCASWNKKA